MTEAEEHERLRYLRVKAARRLPCSWQDIQWLLLQYDALRRTLLESLATKED